MLLSVLKGIVVFMSVATFVILTAALVELWIQRDGDKDPDYKLAIRLLRFFTVGGWLVCALLDANYAWRFYTGLAGSTLPGPESNTVFSLVSFIVSYGFFSFVGVMLLYLLWQADDPTEEELERRHRIAQKRIEAERRRQQRQAGQRRLRRGT